MEKNIQNSASGDMGKYFTEWEGVKTIKPFASGLLPI